MAKTKKVTFPDYIVARNANARRAGLVLEQQVLKGGLLTTWYRGTEAQWRASGFLIRPHMKFPSKSQNGYALTAFGFKLGYYSISGSLKKVSDAEFRGCFSNEEIPEHVQSLGGGIIAYSTHERTRDRDDACTLYAGPTKKALIARGIAPAEIEDNNWFRDAARREDVVWTAGELDGGRHYFRLNLDATERVNRTKAEGREQPFEKPSELVKRFASVFWRDYKMGMLENARVRTVGGETFYIDKDSLEEIDDAAREVYQAIIGSRAFVQPKVSAEIARKTVKAKADSKFLCFMSSVVNIPEGSPIKSKG
jgi:hypothetical protein